MEAQPLRPLWPLLGAPNPGLCNMPPRGLRCIQHQSSSNPGLVHLSEALPGTDPPPTCTQDLPWALKASWEAKDNQRASTQSLPRDSGFIKPPAAGTREYPGRGDNGGSETCGETRNGQDSHPHRLPGEHVTEMVWSKVFPPWHVMNIRSQI